jgi:hypothetical protein
VAERANAPDTLQLRDALINNNPKTTKPARTAPFG